MDTFELEESTERDNYLTLGAGIIYPTSKNLAIVGEWVLKTEMDFMMLSGGVDYNMGNVRYRGALGLGLDDGAPDFQILASYLLQF